MSSANSTCILNFTWESVAGKWTSLDGDILELFARIKFNERPQGVFHEEPFQEEIPRQESDYSIFIEKET